MGAGNPVGVVTNLDKVLEVLRSFEGSASTEYASQKICDTLGVNPEGEWQEPD